MFDMCFLLLYIWLAFLFIITCLEVKLNPYVPPYPKFNKWDLNLILGKTVIKFGYMIRYEPIWSEMILFPFFLNNSVTGISVNGFVFLIFCLKIIIPKALAICQTLQFLQFKNLKKDMICTFLSYANSIIA